MQAQFTFTEHKMTHTEKIVDLNNGDEVIKPYTAEQLAEVKAAQIKKAERDAERAEKDAARQAVLDKLGLTADEVAALLG